ncbi:hypothetical protein ABMA75_03180 [Halobacteriovorax sp. ZH4_bin.1]|uniref:hypothetical protein n=1 Tax=unclassified Halobacteriovorax TaxID=2639665 RepID=UPI00371CBA92
MMKFLKRHKNKLITVGLSLVAFGAIRFVNRNGLLGKVPFVGGQLSQVAGYLG